MLNVYPIRLRFISARLLASVASIFKSAGCKGISFVAAKKLILNVSEPPWMAVVLRSSVFLRSKHVGKKCTGRTFFTVPAVNFSSRLGSTSPISKGLRKGFFQNGQGCPWFHAAATFCAMHKSRRQNAQGWAGDKSETSFGTKLVLYRCTWTYIGREVHGCTLLDRLFQKAYGKCVFKSGGGVCIYFVLHKNKCSTYQNRHGQRWLQAEASLFTNLQPKMNTGVHFGASGWS